MLHNQHIHSFYCAFLLYEYVKHQAYKNDFVYKYASNFRELVHDITEKEKITKGSNFQNCSLGLNLGLQTL